MITLIAAVAKNGVIGNENTIPWHLPADFKHFKETTDGHTVIMGSNTWRSLPEKFRPLPNRLNIIISKSMEREIDRPGFRTFGSVREALEYARTAYEAARVADAYRGKDEPTALPTGEEIFIIGGASIYEQTIHLAQRLIVSEVAQEPEGDTFFPDIPASEWNESARVPKKGFAIVTYDRK